MLKHLNVDQVHFIALLANTARKQRDVLLGNVPENDLGGSSPARGQHNPTAELGLEPLAVDTSEPATALGEAISSLGEPARRELYALMRIGQGHLAAKKLRRGVSEAMMLGDNTITAAIIEDPDLHDHITKGLYEAELAA
jgi:hypothetical protein